MDEPGPNRSQQMRGRVVLVIFIALALLLSLTTILGTWSTLDEQDRQGEIPPAQSGN